MKTLRLHPTLDGPPWSAPQSLDRWAGQLVGVEVGEGAVASIFAEQQLVASLFAARHWVYVLAPGESRGDQSLQEMAERSGLELADVRAVSSRIHYLPAESQLLLLDVRPLPSWEIGGPRPALVRAHVQTPGRFYASFLRNTEALSAAQFLRVTAALVEDCLARAQSTEQAPEEMVRRGMAELGLALEELELLSPIDPGDSTRDAPLVVDAPPLASLARPR